MDLTPYIHISNTDNETKCKNIMFAVRTLPKDFEKYYLADSNEIFLRVNKLFYSISNQSCTTFLDAIFIILFYEDKISMDDLTLFLTTRNHNHLFSWLRSHLTSKKNEDANTNLPRDSLREKHPDFYLDHRMKRSLFHKGFVMAIVTAMYRNGYFIDPHIYQNSYVLYYAKGVMKGLFTNDGKIEEANEYANWVSFPAFCKTVNNISHIRDFFLERVKEYDSSEKLYDDAFQHLHQFEEKELNIAIEAFSLAFLEK